MASRASIGVKEEKIKKEKLEEETGKKGRKRTG